MIIEKNKIKNIISINNNLLLRKYNGVCDFALKWYQDEDALRMLNNSTSPYDMERLKRMYEYQNKCGELYFIEVKKDGLFKPVGDVAISPTDMAIIIGDKNYRGQGIAKKVIKALIQRAINLGYKELVVKEIYDFNMPSQKLFVSCGFVKNEKTKSGYSYKNSLTE